MARVQEPVIPVVAEMIRAHPGTLSLGQGVVHYGPPEAAVRRMQEGAALPAHHLYGPVAGLPPLVDALRAKLAADNGIGLRDGEAVLVTAGGNMAFTNAVLAITDPGDEVILLAPYYFNHDMAIGMAGCRTVVVPTDAAYAPDVAAIEGAITSRTRAVVTVSPNNPTGAVYDEAALRAIGALCRARGIFHISDEAYEYFTYGSARAFSPGSVPGAGAHTISLFSFSKAYGMAGWRMGYMVLPASLLPAVRKIQDTILICPSSAGQLAALGALEAGRAYCRTYVDEMAAVRALVLERLRSLGRGVTVPEPAGAFYVFVRLETDLDDLEVVRFLIAEHGVAVIPGATFGVGEGCYLRIAYGALHKATVAAAMDRLVHGLKALLGG